MFAIPAITGGAIATPILLKAAGEIHRTTVLQSNVLARQGEGTPTMPGEGDRLARQRAAGIKGGLKPKQPQYMKRVPTNKVAGDLRRDYEVGGLGNATSSKGNMTDILSKVPRKVHGADDYKRINRPAPRRAAGFGNQSFAP